MTDSGSGSSRSVPDDSLSTTRGPLKLDTSEQTTRDAGSKTPEKDKARKDSADDLPLRTPSPSKIRTTETFAPSPRATQPGHRQISITLPPPKRRRVGSASVSPSRTNASESLQTPRYAPWDRDRVSSTQQRKQAYHDDEDVSPKTVTRPRKPFRLLHELCKEQEVVLRIATELIEPQDMFNLYAIDASFHYLFSSHQEKFILNSLRIWAPLWPESDGNAKGNRHANLMPFSVYHKLCVRDATRRTVRPIPIQGNPESPLLPDVKIPTFAMPTPPITGIADSANLSTPGPTTAIRLTTPDGSSIFNSQQSTIVQQPATTHKLAKSPVPDETLPTTPLTPSLANVSRLIPTFRYIWFASHRIRTINSIINCLLFTHEFRLPRSMPHTLAKLWLLMDMPTNGARIALVHSARFFTDEDLYRAQLFVLKLDMAFTDPYSGRGETALRKCLLAQRSLSVLEGVLRRVECRSELELARMYLRWKYQPGVTGREEVEKQGLGGVVNKNCKTILGVPIEECGKLELEGWGKKWVQNGSPFSWIEAKEAIIQKKIRQRYMDVANASSISRTPYSSKSPASTSQEAGIATPPPTARTLFLQPRRAAPPPPPPTTSRMQSLLPRQSAPPPLHQRASNPAVSRRQGQSHSAPTANPPSQHQNITRPTTSPNFIRLDTSAPPASSSRPNPPNLTTRLPPTPPLSGPLPPPSAAASANATTNTSQPKPQQPARPLLLRPDELILRASIHRRLNLHLQFRAMMLSGYYDDVTLEPLGAVKVPGWWWEEQRDRGVGMEDLRLVGSGDRNVDWIAGKAETVPLGKGSWREAAEAMEVARCGSKGGEGRERRDDEANEVARTRTSKTDHVGNPDVGDAQAR